MDVSCLPPGQKLKLYSWESQHVGLDKKTNEFNNVRLL